MPLKPQMVHEQIIRVGRELAGKGLVSGRSGNISVRLANGNVLISAKRSFLGMLDLDDLVEIDLNGEVVLGEREPSSEKQMHLQIYRGRKDVDAIVHAHPPYASAYGFLALPLRSVNYENDTVLGDVPIIEYVQPGTLEFAMAVRQGLGDKPAALLQRHGSIACGTDIFDALAIAELLEDVAKVNYLIDTLATAQSFE